MSLEIALERIAECKRTKDTSLDLSGLGLTEIPEEVFELVWLEELSFFCGYGQKGLEIISPEISKLVNLKKLDLSGQKKTDLNPLQGLNQLTQLNLLGTNITDLNPLQGLNQLTQLNLSLIHI